ncbi:increased DNA methylation 1 [Diospyros lotus]|uniref:increased DNA methylation 1 n=1 Tax=Diospyros lotus TaxID=55363 RepID=UPI0022575938|nr:increased DNA methylation 1 [Diospyros lotus]
MLFSKEIHSLHDDGFEGSSSEHRIFSEVFFGNGHDRASKRCLVNPVFNIGSSYCKQADVSLCSNSGNSAITSQVDSWTVAENSLENSVPECSSGGHALLMRGIHNVNGKRIKLSVDELSYLGPYSRGIMNSADTSRGTTSGMPLSASESVCCSVSCRLVESSSRGVISSCYLLKQHADKDSEHNMGNGDVSKSRLRSSAGTNGKEVGASKPIASPVSQESSASKLLVTTPLAAVAIKSGSGEERMKSSNNNELPISKMSVNQDFMKDPRPILRNHSQNLFRAAGWKIGRRKRGDKFNGEFLYFSPQGGRGPIREFHRAWKLCGQRLFADRNIVVQEDSKQWTNMSDFWSDLSNTLRKIEEELNNTENTNALAHQWCLLDPFANMVFVDKKLGALKAGQVVKSRSFVIDASTKDAAALDFKNMNLRDQSERRLPDQLHDSFPVKGSVLTDSGGNHSVCNEQHGIGVFSNCGQLQGGVINSLEGVSVYAYKDTCKRPRDTISGTGTQHTGISMTERGNDGPNSSQACGVDGACDHSKSHMFEVSLTSGNANIILGGPETVSTHEDSNVNSSRDDHRFGDGEEMGLGFNKTVSVNSSGGKSLSEEELESLSDHPSWRNDDLVQSQYEDMTRLDSVLCNPSIVENSHLVDANNMEILQHSGITQKVSGWCIADSKFVLNDASSGADTILKRKTHKKSKKISEIKLAAYCQNDKLGRATNKAGGHEFDENIIQSDSGKAQNSAIASISIMRNERSSKKEFICSSQLQKKKQSRLGKFHHGSRASKKLNNLSNDDEHSKEFEYVNDADESPMHAKNECLDLETWRNDIKSERHETQNENGHKRSIACQHSDDDLLISAVIKNKTFRAAGRECARKMKSRRTVRRRKSQKGSCRLLPRSLGKGGKHMEGKWSLFSVRTVLSWLINSRVISLNEIIQYRNLKDDTVVKDGVITQDGILCKCCSEVLSVSRFRNHAGFRLNRPCMNLVMESGKPFTLCQLEAWSAEYRARKSAIQTVQVDELDQNDDSCGLCGYGGELICCDNCPSTFHQACLYAQELPEGNWYCPHCICRICGDVVMLNDKDASMSPPLQCAQCEHKYHKACLKGRGAFGEAASDTRFCGESCQGVYLGLHSCIGLVNLLSDGFSWTLMRCIHGDHRVHSAQKFIALKAECNSKLAVALTIMEECFVSMVDPRTGIDMIPHVLYNWGSKFARLNYHGFYTVILEKDDVLLSAASVRIHGVTVAEMPLIATCSKYRRQGMCRRLMNAIEEMLKSFKVKKLVISAIPSVVETWTVGFGFEPLEEDERRSLSNINLMVFPGTVWLKKTIHENLAPDQDSHDNPTTRGPCSEEVPIDGSSVVAGGSASQNTNPDNSEGTIANGSSSTKEVASGNICSKHMQENVQRASTAAGSQLEMVCHVESEVMYDDEKEPSSAKEVGESQLETAACHVESGVMYGDEWKLSLGEQSQDSLIPQDNDK